jgi:hypothetical protein
MSEEVPSVSQPLPIPADQVAGPVHPIIANFVWWMIKRERGDKDSEEFGDRLLAHLEAAPSNPALPGAETLLVEVERIIANSNECDGPLHDTLRKWIRNKRAAGVSGTLPSPQPDLELTRRELRGKEDSLIALEKRLEHAKTTFFYIRNLAHDAWRDPPNLVEVCKRIEDYARAEIDGLTKFIDGEALPSQEGTTEKEK